MKYKKAYILSGIVIFIAAIVGVWLEISYNNKVNFSKKFMDNIGGEQALKRKCMKDNSGPHRMSDGTIQERLLSVSDIRRIPKLCDCMVEKSYKMIMKMKPKLEQADTDNLAQDVIETFQSMLSVNYDFCEDEVIDWLESKYKTIDMQ